MIGNGVGLPPGTNRSYVSVYSPFQVWRRRASAASRPACRPSSSWGATSTRPFVDIPPGGIGQIELDLEGTIEGRRYGLDMPVQPFASTDQVEVKVEVAGVDDVVSREATVDGQRRHVGHHARSRPVAVGDGARRLTATTDAVP